jgi:hypothetical protein
MRLERDIHTKKKKGDGVSTDRNRIGIPGSDIRAVDPPGPNDASMEGLERTSTGLRFPISISLLRHVVTAWL